MTQPTGLDLDGAQPDAQQEPEAPQEQARPDVDLRSLAEHLRPQDTPTEPTGGLDDDGDQDDAEAEEEAPEGSPAKQTRSVEEWEQILAEQPQRLNELPGKMRVEVLTRALQAKRTAEEQSRTAGYSAGREFERDLVMAREVAAIDAFSGTNPEEFGEWVREHPDRYAAYQEHRPRLMAKYRQSAGDLIKMAESQPAGPSMEQRLIQKASEVVSPLRDYPGAKARILANGVTYTNDLDGVMRLAADVAREIEVDRQNEERPARQRQQAANEVRNRPKPVVAGGASTRGEITADALKAMNPNEVYELQRTPEGKAAIERALARS